MSTFPVASMTCGRGPSELGGDGSRFGPGKSPGGSEHSVKSLAGAWRTAWTVLSLK